MKRSFIVFTTLLAMGAFLLLEGALHAEKIGTLVVKYYLRSVTEVGDVVKTEDGSIPLIAELPGDAGSAPVTGKGKWKVETVINFKPFGRLPPDSSPMREEIRGRLLWRESGEVDYMTLKLDHWGRLMADGSMSPGGMSVETLPLLDGLFWKCPWAVTLPGASAKGYKRVELRIDNKCLQMIGVLETAKRFYDALNSLNPEDGEELADYKARVYDEANPYNDSSLGELFLAGECQVYLPGFDYFGPEDYSPYDIVKGISPLPLKPPGVVPLDSSATAWQDAEKANMELIVRDVHKWLSENDCDKWR